MVTIPNGTLNRWDVISIWMSDHGAEKERDGKTILKKAKELEKTAARGPLGKNYRLEQILTLFQIQVLLSRSSKRNKLRKRRRVKSIRQNRQSNRSII